MAVSVSEEAKNAIADLDREEEEFATRLQKLMIEKGVTQQQLAEKLKVGQPAISNMLNRQCRPQRRTIYRIAGALGVNPEELWPNIE